MSFDYYASLSSLRVDPKASSAPDLASGFADECTAWSAKGDGGRKNARRTYQQQAGKVEALTLPDSLGLDSDWTPIIPGWFALSVKFELQTPWYSKDDRPFHVLDNPVRKDRVFGVPFMSAASWKGLLRWACRMEAKDSLLQHLEKHDNTLDGWSDPAWILHLFGNEKAEDSEFKQGALAFRPTWFSKVGFELINPHDRARRAGTVPIVYEVVPAGRCGTLRLLYAPRPGEPAPEDTFQRLFDAIEKLLTVYGFSAKRTAGWGLAKVKQWKLDGVGGVKQVKDSAAALAQLNAVRFSGGAS